MIERFVSECASLAAAAATPSDAVVGIAPLMQRLALERRAHLRPEHFRSDPEHYARNLVHAAPDGSLSLFVLVWRPGQWTAVHDHGTWGVVGVLEGTLVEQSYMRLDANPHEDRDNGIKLVRGGLVLLAPGSVSTFVPNPDHIHQTGAPEDEGGVMSLHLYGRMLSSFHVYDLEAGTRKLFEAPHSES
ncbi:MAG: cysteine dioxygenase family protein [Proteobacteria bacterium]|nr:cysteine dioxygenase family protein [Pseudomonadota bacterium]